MRAETLLSCVANSSLDNVHRVDSWCDRVLGCSVPLNASYDETNHQKHEQGSSDDNKPKEKN